MRTPEASSSPISSGGLVAEGVAGRIFGVTVFIYVSLYLFSLCGRLRLDQAQRSMSSAMPWPPPMHSVISP